MTKLNRYNVQLATPSFDLGLGEVYHMFVASI